MAVAYRSQSTTTYASRSNTSVSVPAGVANDDILIAHIFVGAGSSAPTVTPPSGFTQIGTTISMTDGGSFNGKVSVYWKRASGEAGSYVFSHSTASSQLRVAAYAGCKTSGSPINASSQNNGTGTTLTATGITTTVADVLGVWLSNDWQGNGNLLPPGGSPTFTERFDSLIYAADATFTTAGATGNKTQTSSGNGSENWSVFFIGLEPASGGGSQQDITGSLFSNSQTFYAAAVKGTYTVTGARLDNSSAFYGATVTPGSVTINAALYTDPDTFYGATIGRGAVNITGVLFENANAFYGSTVSATYAIQGTRFDNTNTFYGAIIAPGAVTITGALFQNSPTFYGATISQASGPQDITGARFDNTNTFYGSTVTTSYTITGALFQSANTFYGATVANASGPQTINGTRFDNQNTFFGATISGTGDEPIRQPGGFLPTILLDRKGRPVSLKDKKNEVLQKARAVVKELPAEDKQDAKEAIRDLAAEVTAQHVRELQEILSGANEVLDRAMAELARLAEEAEDEDDIEFLLLAS